MCCSVSPRVQVRFSDTVLYAAEVIGSANEPVHVLGYQNKVQGNVGRSWLLPDWLSFARSGNAMILPFPAVPETMTRANVLDTSNCRDVLQDLANTVAPRYERAYLSRSARAGPRPRVQVFDAAGIYTVVLAQDPREISGALSQVPRSKRPALNPALFDAYSRWYPGWTVALCCFNNRRAQLASPLLWWYEPMHPDRLFLPGVDGHTGDVPDLDAPVDVDHVVVVGSHRTTGGQGVFHKSAIPETVAPYICRSVIGRRFAQSMPNGDFVCRLEDVREGIFSPGRVKPIAA